MKPLPNRKLNRLKGYDYAQNGFYFLTICTKNRAEFFGKIQNGGMVLNQFGEITRQCWKDIPIHFPDVSLGEFIVMPNHIHGILILDRQSVGNNNPLIIGNNNYCSLRKIPWQTQLSRSISSVIRGFKIGATQYFHQNNNFEFAWQKSFYDHIIRNEKAYYQIQQYIINNPINWEMDKDRNHYFSSSRFSLFSSVILGLCPSITFTAISLT